MLYWTYNTLAPAIGLFGAVFLAGITGVLILITARTMGSPKRVSDDPNDNLAPRARQLRLVTLALTTLTVFMAFTQLTEKSALIHPKSPNHSNPALDLLVGGPESIDRSTLIRFGALGLMLSLMPILPLNQGLQPSGWIRERVDRWRAPNARRGDLGSAHFCTPREYSRYRKPDRKGIVLKGAFYGDKRQRVDSGLGQFCLKLEDAARGLICFGRPGSGKTQGVILPVIADSMKYEHSLIVADPQGELLAYILEYSKVTGHRIIVHDPTSRTAPRYNLAQGIASVSDAQQIAAVLIKQSGSGDMSFWDNNAQNLLGACLFRFPNLGEILKATGDVKQLAAKLREASSDAERDASQLANAFISSAIDSDGKLASSIIATLSTSLEGWTDGIVRDNTAESDFDIEDFLAQPSVIVLTCPEEKQEIYARYLGAVLRKLMLDLDRVAQENRNPNKKGMLPVPVNIILDEFPTLGRLESVVGKVNLVRKRGIMFLLAAQTKGQLEKIYGREGTQSLLTGMGTQIVYGGGDNETNDYYSKVSGLTTINTSSDPTKNNSRQRPLLTADEVASPTKGNMTIIGSYVESNYAVQAVLTGELTRIYERRDWSKALAEHQNSPIHLLKRPPTIRLSQPNYPSTTTNATPTPSTTPNSNSATANTTKPMLPSQYKKETGDQPRNTRQIVQEYLRRQPLSATPTTILTDPVSREQVIKTNGTDLRETLRKVSLAAKSTA